MKTTFDHSEEYENLSEEEKKKVDQQVSEQVNYDYGKLAADTKQNAKAYEEHGATIEGDSLRYWSDEEEQNAKKEASTFKPIQYYDEPSKKEDTKPSVSYGSSGTYGVLKNEDFTEYRKKRSEQIARQKAAIIAGERAAQAEQARLLATGMYFSDGRGNIKLKKEYRKQGGKGRRGYYDKDTEHNTYAGMTEMAINKARQTAYDAAMEGYDGFEGALRRQEEEKAAKGRAKTQEIVEQNGFELAQQEERKKQRGINISKGHLAIFDGLVAAYKALDSDYNVSAVNRDERRSGLLRDGQGRLIGAGASYQKQTYADNDGIRVQNGEDGKPTARNGFVGIGTIDTINKRLRETGNNEFKITGIIARQKIDAIGNKAEPMFYVQGIRADGTQFGKTMSMKDVYNFGKENYIGSGENDENAENNVIDTFSDVFGVRKRQEEAKMRDPKYREMVAKAKLAESKAEHPNSLTFDQRMQLQASQNQNRLAIAQLNAEQRQKATEAARVLNVAKAKLAEFKTEHPDWLTFDQRMQLQASQNQNRLAIAQLNAEQRQKATEAARVLKELGYAIDIDLAEAKAADASARSMDNAKRGITNEAKYTPEQIEAEKKRAEEARNRARGKIGSRQENASRGDNRSNESPKPKLTREEAIKKLLATGKFKLENGKVVPK